MDRHRPLTLYYLATPLFALVDVGWDAPVRVAGLGDDSARWVYYAGLVALGLVCRRWPSTAPWVGMSESVVNLVLLLLSVLLPIWSAPDAILAGGTPEGLLDQAALGNVALSGTALVWAFHRHRRSAFHRGAPGRTMTEL